MVLWFNVTFSDISACSVKGQMSSFKSVTCCEEPTSWVAKDTLVPQTSVAPSPSECPHAVNWLLWESNQSLLIHSPTRSLIFKLKRWRIFVLEMIVPLYVYTKHYKFRIPLGQIRIQFTRGKNCYIVDFPQGKFGYKRGEIWLYSQISPGGKTTI